MPVLQHGLVQVYTGDGKGKTTAALGAVWRMLGWGGMVYVCQFLKPAGMKTGEKNLAQKFNDTLIWDAIEIDWNMSRSFDDSNQFTAMALAIEKKMDKIQTMAQKGEYDLIVLDEIIFCLSKSLLKLDLLKNVIKNKAPHVELILTGRGADESITALADLVSEISAIKHPYKKSIHARKGIEY